MKYFVLSDYLPTSLFPRGAVFFLLDSFCFYYFFYLGLDVLRNFIRQVALISIFADRSVKLIVDGPPY